MVLGIWGTAAPRESIVFSAGFSISQESLMCTGQLGNSGIGRSSNLVSGGSGWYNRPAIGRQIKEDMTTPRQNLLKVLRHEPPDWVPINMLADTYNRPSGLPAGFYQGVESSLIHLALARYFDIDILDRVDGAWVETYRGNVRHTGQVEGDNETRRWETPYGIITSRLRQVRFESPTAGEPELTTRFPVEYPIKSVQDYRAFAHIMEALQYTFNPDLVKQRLAWVGEEGVVVAWAPPTPLGMCVRYYTGVEHIAFAWSDHRHEFMDLLALIAEKYAACYRGLAELPIDGAIITDDTTTQAISPAMFRELEVPAINRFADILHARGKACIHHACGHVLRLLDDFRDTRIDAFDGLAPPTTGDTRVAAARAKLGMGVTIMPFTEEEALKSSDPATVRAGIHTMFAEAASPQNLVINILPSPGVPVGNVWLAVDEAKTLAHRCRG
jgi:hypothetical protein